MTKIAIDLSSVGQITWQQYATRFLAGGLITAIVGIIAKEFGPGIGGLFLAFPSIFPASATLIEEHELKKKRSAGVKGVSRSRDVAGVEAAGAAMGSLGLLGFALTVYKMLGKHPSWQVLGAAVLLWAVLSVLLWRIRKAV